MTRRPAEQPPAPAEKPLECSFCGKEHRLAKKLIAGPRVFICDECVQLCAQIIVEANIPTSEAVTRMNAAEIAAFEHAKLARRVRELESIVHRAASMLAAELPATEVWRCVWCDEITHSDSEARAHAATCEKHPAVIALRAREASPA